MSEYILYLVKTVRKFNGDIITVSQEVEDVLSNPIVKQAIINNTDCLILLDQSKYKNRFGMIKDVLGLTGDQVAQVLSINRANDPAYIYKEAWISAFSKVYRLEVSPAEYYSYTTHAAEKVKVEAYVEAHGGFEKGITAFLNDLKTQ